MSQTEEIQISDYFSSSEDSSDFLEESSEDTSDLSEDDISDYSSSEEDETPEDSSSEVDEDTSKEEVTVPLTKEEENVLAQEQLEEIQEEKSQWGRDMYNTKVKQNLVRFKPKFEADEDEYEEKDEIPLIDDNYTTISHLSAKQKKAEENARKEEERKRKIQMYNLDRRQKVDELIKESRPFGKLNYPIRLEEDETEYFHKAREYLQRSRKLDDRGSKMARNIRFYGIKY